MPTRKLTSKERRAVREKRIARGLTLASAARDIGVSRQTLHNLLGGLQAAELTIGRVRGWIRESP